MIRPPADPETSPAPTVDTGADPRWCVLGAGAMGCLWAAHLWQGWQKKISGSLPVTLLLRDEAELARYRQAQGITLEDGISITSLPVPACTIAEARGPITHLLLTTKTLHVLDALDSVRHLIDAQTRLVMLQNGLRLQRELSAAWGAQRVFCLSTTHGAWRREAFRVVHAGHGQAWLGTLADDSSGDSAEAVAELISQLPVPALSLQADADIAFRLWHKFAINCAINALTVIHDCRNGQLLELPDAHAQLIALGDEIEQLCSLLPEAPSLPGLYDRVADVLRTTADNWSSSLQDVRKGRPTEIPHLNAYLCELARNRRLDCPVNEDILDRFYQTVRTIP